MGKPTGHVTEVSYSTTICKVVGRVPGNGHCFIYIYQYLHDGITKLLAKDHHHRR